MLHSCSVWGFLCKLRYENLPTASSPWRTSYSTETKNMTLVISSHYETLWFILHNKILAAKVPSLTVIFISQTFPFCAKCSFVNTATGTSRLTAPFARLGRRNGGSINMDDRTNSVEQRPSWESVTRSGVQGSPVSCSQEPVNGPYPETDQPSPYPHTLFL